MIKLNKIESEEQRGKLRKGYIEMLGQPIDGYWESVVINYSNCYEIIHEGKVAGHCSVDKKNILVQFYVTDEKYKFAEEIMRYLILNGIIEKAAVSTKESRFLSVCLEIQESIVVDTYLFTHSLEVKSEISKFGKAEFKLAVVDNIADIKEKCDSAFEGYYEGLIENDQLFVLYNGNDLLGIGEFRVMASNNDYGDIGVVVAEEHRKKGVGSYIISKLKDHCYSKNIKPLACCDVNNTASKNTMQKAGFICNHKIMIVEFKK